MRFTGQFFELTDRLPQAARPRTSAGPRLVISVAKRIVKSAVRRNTVKRVVRESWRVHVGGRPDASALAWMIRLRAHPLPRARQSPARAAMGPLPGFARVKQLLRADVERLMDEALRARSRRLRPSDQPANRTVNSSPLDRQVPETPAQ